MKLHNRHAFETFDMPPNNRDGCFSGVQHKRFDFTNIPWVWLNCPLSGVF